MDFISDPQVLLAALGPWVVPGVALVLFVESGLLFPFLPGDSLIFTAALLHEEFGFGVWTLVVVGIIAAFLGVQVGYWLGAKFGRRLFTDDARILKTEYMERAEEFFDKWGAVSLVLSRFVPIVRTFVPLAAGIARMDYKKFVFYNTVAAIAWVGLMTILGLTLGQIDYVRNNIDVIAILIVLISVLPMVVAWVHSKIKQRRQAAEA